MRRFNRILISSTLVASVMPIGNWVAAQDLVPVNDISGGSSVFVFRNSSKGAPQKFVTKQKSRVNKEARIESAKRITTQYETLAKVTPRRARAAVVDPNDPRIKGGPGSMPPQDASKLFTGVGEYYIDKNDSENAINFFREAVDLDAKNTIAPKGLSEALALKGNELLVKDQAKAAKALFDESLTYNPKNAVAYYGLAEVFTDQDLESEAVRNESIKDYETALQYDKDLTEIYVPLGILYYQATDRPNNIARADELLTKAVAANPNTPETQYFYGLVRFAQNKNAEALAAFRNAVRLRPDYAEAHYYLGEALERDGKHAEAAAEYDKALSLKPNYFEAALDLGSAYYEQEKWPEAAAAYEKAVKLKNDSVQAYINLGDAYRQAKNYEKAEGAYNLAATFIERGDTLDRVDAADTYNKIGYVIAQQCPINAKSGLPCRWNVATASLEKAVALTHDNVDYANLGWAYYNAAKKDFADNKAASGKEKLEKARVNLQKAVAADSRFLTAPLVNLGLALNDLQDYKSATDVLNRVVTNKPDWTFARNALGVSYYFSKDYSSAIDQFKKAIDKDNKYVDAWFNLGKAQFANGNVGEAKKAYSQLRKLGPKGNQLADQLDRETGGAMART
ncbi:MAG TPA: tetratricopeptide repeat protein [Pyrinomonadaceae bacterium]|nr:tetratricopeptide repeat protein [Pyrinomonadaceae bacterium]